MEPIEPAVNDDVREEEQERVGSVDQGESDFPLLLKILKVSGC